MNSYHIASHNTKLTDNSCELLVLTIYSELNNK